MAAACLLVTGGCGGRDEPQLADGDAARLLQGIERVRSAASDGRTAAALTATARLRTTFASIEARDAFAPDERTAVRAELRRLEDVLERRRERERARARARAQAEARRREAEELAAQQAAAAAAPAPAEKPESRERDRSGTSRDGAPAEPQEAGGAQWPERDDARGRSKDGGEKPGKGNGKTKGWKADDTGGGRAPAGAGGDGDDDD